MRCKFQFTIILNLDLSWKISCEDGINISHPKGITNPKHYDLYKAQLSKFYRVWGTANTFIFKGINFCGLVTKHIFVDVCYEMMYDTTTSSCSYIRELANPRKP
jgi:hypothetical protein